MSIKAPRHYQRPRSPLYDLEPQQLVDLIEAHGGAEAYALRTGEAKKTVWRALRKARDKLGLRTRAKRRTPSQVQRARDAARSRSLQVPDGDIRARDDMTSYTADEALARAAMGR